MSETAKELFFVLLGAMLGGNLVLAQGFGLRTFSFQERSPGKILREGAGLAGMIFLSVLAAVSAEHYLPEGWNPGWANAGVALGASLLVFGLGSVRSFPAKGGTTPVLLFAAAMIALLEELGPAEAACYGLGAGFGAAAATALLAGISERLDFSVVPRFFKSAPVYFIALGILSLVFHYFRELTKMH